jgi:hypothetical protein
MAGQTDNRYGQRGLDQNSPEFLAALALKASKLHYETIEILMGGDKVLDGTTNTADAYTVITDTGSAIVRNFGGAAGNVNSNVKINFRMPDDYVPNTPIYFNVGCFITNATKLASSEKVAFSLAGACLLDNEGLSKAMGTAVVVSKTASADFVTNKRCVTDYSSGVTIADLVGGGYVKLNLTRVTDDVNDTYAKPIGVSSIVLKYQSSTIAVS